METAQACPGLLERKGGREVVILGLSQLRGLKMRGCGELHGSAKLEGAALETHVGRGEGK